MSTLADSVRRLCAQAEGVAAGTPLAGRGAGLAQRLDQPLRVAIAGRAKAGKSTLLNALVGERLAPTDAGECTKLVTWYQHGLGYDVRADLRDGSSVPVPFTRTEGRLSMDLAALDPRSIERLVVSWPSRALERVTLIDTPGLASLDEESSLRTQDLLAMGEGRPTDADAVIYLLRHLHRQDVEFLGSFLDRRVAASSPANALGVLSRADEIGSCRLDAMGSARRIADRYQADADVRSLCTAVVPFAGLAAETGLTLREDEAQALRTLAATPGDVLASMLLSVDRFCDPGASDLTVEVRRSLLLRLGLFGLRLALRALQDDPGARAITLARMLVDASGLEHLREVISASFFPRAEVLQARSVLVGLRALAAALRGVGDDGVVRDLAAAIERLESETSAFSELRVTHLVLSGQVGFDDDERAELRRLLQPGSSPPDRLALAADTPGDALAVASLTGAARWRERAADPVNDSARREVCEAMAHSYEATYLQVAGAGSGS